MFVLWLCICFFLSLYFFLLRLWSLSGVVVAVAAATQKVGRVISAIDTLSLFVLAMKMSIIFLDVISNFFFSHHHLQSEISYFNEYNHHFIDTFQFTHRIFTFHRQQRQKKMKFLNLNGLPLNKTLFWAASFGVMC